MDLTYNYLKASAPFYAELQHFKYPKSCHKAEKQTKTEKSKNKITLLAHKKNTMTSYQSKPKSSVFNLLKVSIRDFFTVYYYYLYSPSYVFRFTLTDLPGPNRAKSNNC